MIVHALFVIIIAPLQQILEGLWLLLHDVTGNTGIAILGLSLAVTVICLPFYRAAASIQERERLLQRVMQPGISRIKTAFHGEERHMMLSTFYRQHRYHPIMTLRGSCSVLVQIPFFIAAWEFLSHLQQIQGVSFLGIPDLGKPDALIRIGNTPINILPVLMTSCNLVSGFVYAKGHGIWEKLQIATLAAAFFVLLYNEPSALLLYWTANNILSLAKNIVYKPKARQPAQNVPDSQKHFLLFILCCSSLWILCGSTIPSCVIASAPEEFSYIDSYTTPQHFVSYSFFQAAGFCIFWPSCFFFVCGSKSRKTLAFLSVIILCFSLTDYFIFSGYYGILTTNFVFDNWKPDVKLCIANLIILLVLFPIIHLLFRWHMNALTASSAILCIALLFLSALNGSQIQTAFKRIPKKTFITEETIAPVYRLSPTHRNVTIVFLDRFTSAFFPSIIRECPELASDFSGFVYYPNTISYGIHTIVGAPALLGGYEYRPEQINARKEELLQSKIDEAYSLLPRIFSTSGFAVIFSNPDDIGASPAFLSSMATINVPETNHAYRNIWYARHGNETAPARSALIKRDLIRLSLFKCAPAFCRPAIYWHHWWEIQTTQDINNFVDAYSALEFLPELTDCTSKEPVFLFLNSVLPHESLFLDAPSFTVPPSTATRVMKSVSSFSDVPDYYSAAASMQLLAKWLRYLKTQGCYDNNRIIFASDHGARVTTGRFSNNSICPTADACNPLLLVKDFNRDGLLTTDERFMTQADVPYLASESVIANPINPATGQLLSTREKDGVQKLFMNHQASVRKEDTVYKTHRSEWFTVHNSILNPSNWGTIVK